MNRFPGMKESVHSTITEINIYIYNFLNPKDTVSTVIHNVKIEEHFHNFYPACAEQKSWLILCITYCWVGNSDWFHKSVNQGLLWIIFLMDKLGLHCNRITCLKPHTCIIHVCIHKTNTWLFLVANCYIIVRLKLNLQIKLCTKWNELKWGRVNRNLLYSCICIFILVLLQWFLRNLFSVNVSYTRGVYGRSTDWVCLLGWNLLSQIVLHSFVRIKYICYRHQYGYTLPRPVQRNQTCTTLWSV